MVFIVLSLLLPYFKHSFHTSTLGGGVVFFFFSLNNLLLLLFALELHSTSGYLLGSVLNRGININFPPKCSTQTFIHHTKQFGTASQRLYTGISKSGDSKTSCTVSSLKHTEPAGFDIAQLCHFDSDSTKNHVRWQVLLFAPSAHNESTLVREIKKLPSKKNY